MKRQTEIQQLKIRLTSLEDTVRAQQEALRMACEALAGHQRILEAQQTPVTPPAQVKFPTTVN